MRVGAEDDVAEAEAAARRALGVCLYTGPGCGAHQRFDRVEDAQAWCAAHQAAHPDHRVDIWSADIDDLAIVNPITRAIYASLIDAKRVEAARRADPDWGKTWVTPEFYEAVRERAETSPEMKTILGQLRPMMPMEAPHDERSDPRTQPIPIARSRRKGKRRR